jgi:hypothetical protein
LTRKASPTISRDSWTEDVREKAILGLLADDAMRARLKGMPLTWR